MNIDDKTVMRIAELSKLEFNTEEREEICKDLNRIDQLNTLNTDEVEPLMFMSDEVNVLREDVVVESITQDEALKNAPKKDSDYFRVPKVLSK
jgi:aspartyl-tRNA(Asn)/glutamyl-tRNA(Gln) amidotransferase subunit C